jgi:hypothetical protein
MLQDPAHRGHVFNGAVSHGAQHCVGLGAQKKQAGGIRKSGVVEEPAAGFAHEGNREIRPAEGERFKIFGERADKLVGGRVGRTGDPLQQAQDFVAVDGAALPEESWHIIPRAGDRQGVWIL